MEQDLELQQGDTWSIEVLWTNEDLTPKDLTGCEAKMQIRSSVSSIKVQMELSTEVGTLVIDGPAGRIVTDVGPPATSDVRPQYGVYDLQVKFPDSTVKTILWGSVFIRPEVTR